MWENGRMDAHRFCAIVGGPGSTYKKTTKISPTPPPILHRGKKSQISMPLVFGALPFWTGGLFKDLKI